MRNSGRIITQAPNAKTTQELLRGMIYRELFLRLTAQPTLTAANNIVNNMSIGDEWAIVKSIDLRLDGKDIIKSISGPALRWLDYYLYGVFPQKSTGTLGDGVTANPLVDSTMILPLWMPKSVKPMDFALDTRLLSRIDMDVTWGSFTDINSAATGFTTGAQIQIYDNEVANVNGNFARWNIFPLSQVFSAGGAKQQMKLPVGYLYRGFLIQDASNVINTIRFKSGALFWFDLDKQVISTALDDTRRAGNIVTGITNNLFWRAGVVGDDQNHWIYIDMVNDGFNAESIDSYGMSEIFLEFDLSGAGTITVWPQQLVIPRM